MKRVLIALLAMFMFMFAGCELSPGSDTPYYRTSIEYSYPRADIYYVGDEVPYQFVTEAVYVRYNTIKLRGCHNRYNPMDSKLNGIGVTHIDMYFSKTGEKDGNPVYTITKMVEDNELSAGNGKEIKGGFVPFKVVTEGMK